MDYLKIPHQTPFSSHFHSIFLTRFVNQKLKGLHLRIGIILTFHETINMQLGHYIDDLNLFFLDKLQQTAVSSQQQIILRRLNRKLSGSHSLAWFGVSMNVFRVIRACSRAARRGRDRATVAQADTDSGPPPPRLLGTVPLPLVGSVNLTKFPFSHLFVQKILHSLFSDVDNLETD